MTWIQRFFIVAIASGLIIFLIVLFPVWSKWAQAQVRARAAEMKANHSCDCVCK